VNARDTLVQTLTNALAVTRVGRLDTIRAEAERLVDEALKEHAHELAKKQHATAREYEATQSEDFVAGMQVGADLVDPEVTRA
jgi:hypothetical protein